MTAGADVRVHAMAPILALDIDGTLADYYGGFKTFAEQYLQRNLGACDSYWHWSKTDDFHDVLGIELHEYRQIKLAYRQGGMKRSLPLMPQDIQFTASDMVQGLRDIGIQVWVATTRPWMRLDNIDPDTQFWLDRNVGRVDGLVYGEDKYDQLVDIATTRGQEILGVVDDLGVNLERAQALGLRTALRVGPHNFRWLQTHATTNVVSSAWAIYSIAIEWKNES